MRAIALLTLAAVLTGVICLTILTLIFKEDFKHSLPTAIAAGIGAALGLVGVYYFKKRQTKGL